MTSLVREPHDTVLDSSVAAGTAAEPGGARYDERPRRVFYFDYLRVFATLGVVSIHSATQVFNATRTQDGVGVLSHYTVADLGESIGRFGVGCFFMVSGALLLDARHRFRLPKQLMRVAVPLVVWSCLYLLADSWWAHQGLPTNSGLPGQTGDLSGIGRALLAGTVSNHFWFVYALIACYLALPLLRPVTALPAVRQKRLLEYALALWAVTFLVLPTVRHYAPGTLVPNTDLLPALPSKYLGFVVLGYYLHRYGVRIRGWQPGRGALIATAVAAFLTIAGLTLGAQLTGSRSTWAQSNPTLPVAIYAASVFLLAKLVLDRPGRRFAFVALFSRLSFRIYLVHMLVLFWLRSISPLNDLYKSQPELSIVLLGSITLAVSFGIAWGIDRLPRLRRWV